MTKPTITIPATAEATSEARVEQSKRNLEREGLTALRLGKHESKVFKRGIKLDPSNCILTTPLDDWTPPPEVIIPLSDRVAQDIKDRVEKEFGPSGLASFIAISDTTAGVREVITYDENEEIVKPIVEGDQGDETD